jgi:Na+-driven multidrug efflux pump
MILEKEEPFEKYGVIIGFLFSFFLFTTILFFVLSLLNKIPDTWSYLHIMIITVVISLIGTAFRRFLK